MKVLRNVSRLLVVAALVAATLAVPLGFSSQSQAQADDGETVAIWVQPMYVSADGVNYQYYQQFFIESCPTYGTIFSDGGYMSVANALSARGYWTQPGPRTFWRYGTR